MKAYAYRWNAVTGATERSAEFELNPFLTEQAHSEPMELARALYPTAVRAGVGTKSGKFFIELPAVKSVPAAPIRNITHIETNVPVANPVTYAAVKSVPATSRVKFTTVLKGQDKATCRRVANTTGISFHDARVLLASKSDKFA